MKNILIVIAISIAIASTSASLCILVSHAFYERDVRNCMHEGTREQCEEKFK